MTFFFGVSYFEPPCERLVSMARRKKIVPITVTKGPSRQMWKRSIVLAVLVAFGFFAVTYQLVMLQIIKADSWKQLAVEDQLNDIVLAPNRGTIYDAKMNTLAESQLAWTITMSPKNIPNDEVRQLIVNELPQLLDIDRESLLASTQKTYSQYEYVKRKIDKDLKDAFIEWVQKHKLTNIFQVNVDYKRVYPYNNLLSSVLGFTGTDYNGLYGLEAQYESVLRGKPGRVITIKDGVGDNMPNELSFEKTVEVENGHDLVLTIDQTIQHYVEKHLEIGVKTTNSIGRGLAIVMNVKTGAILAMATKTDYDPNKPFEIADPDERAKIDLLSGDEKSEAIAAARQRQWNNKAVYDFYEPGSVFKIFTSAMGLEEGVVNENSTFVCTGQYKVGDRVMKCHVYPRSHGTQKFGKAISNSCNPAFFQLAQKIGGQTFFKYFKGFGFTERTGIDMLGESQVTTSLYHGANMTEVNLTTSAIGQTFKVTPIQMITGVAAVANGGNLMVPYVVQQELDAQGNVVKNTTPTVKRQVISEDTARRLCQMLADAVNGGGSRNAYVPGYRVAGKTGTADKTEMTGEKNDVWASFAGFAPADDPEIAVLVVLDSPQCSIRYGGTIAAPIAQKILADTLPYLGIEPKYTQEEIAAMHKITPKVEGETVVKARNRIENEGLNCTVVGNGSTVLKQVPASGASIPKGGTVVLYTEEGEQSHLVTVPDFTNMTVSKANQAAAAAGVNLLITGLNSGDGEPLVASQSIPPGTQVERSSVVTVNLVYRDAIA